MSSPPRPPFAPAEVATATGAVDPMDEWDPGDAQILRNLFLDEAEGHMNRLAGAFARLTDAADAHASFTPGEELDELFRALHTLKGAAGSVGHDAIANATHELEDLCAELRAGQLLPTPGILDRIAEDLGTVRALLDGARQMPMPSHAPREKDPQADASHNRRSSDRRRGDRRFENDRRLSMDSGAVEEVSDHVGDLVILRTRIERRLSELTGLKRELTLGRHAMRRSLGWLMADSDRGLASVQSRRSLSRLSELELELATAMSHLDRATSGLAADTDAIRRTTVALDESLRSLRLVSFNWLFRRLQLALDELQTSTETPIVLETDGGELELDRSVLEHLFDPALQLLRNAIIHGVEPPEDRQRLGKPSTGLLRLSARLEGDYVFLSFSDDGRGVDREGVRQALRRRNRMVDEIDTSDEKLMEILFEPGFSTRATADALAGRGMGLNIVKTSVMKLGGSVTCHFTTGVGTTFTLCIPLSTAITQALLFKLGGQVYAAPLNQVVAALPPASDSGPAARSSLDGEVQLASGQSLPVLRLQGVFGVETPPDHRLSLLHMRFGSREFAITCDRIIGPRTVVVRPLGPILGLLPYFVGATVSGAGKVQLVLDVAALAALAHRTEKLPSAPTRRGSPRVLVVDDSRLAREAAARALASMGLQTLTAEDGWEAWELLNERRFDAVVTDLEMPRVDGFALIARIRKDPTLKRMPIVVLSSRTSQATQERAKRLGASAVVVKAPQRHALVRTLQKLLLGARGG